MKKYFIMLDVNNLNKNGIEFIGTVITFYGVNGASNIFNKLGSNSAQMMER